MLARYIGVVIFMSFVIAILLAVIVNDRSE